MADFYIDFETVRESRYYSDISEKKQALFAKRYFSERYQLDNPNMTIDDRWVDQAGLTAEFGMIVCMSVSWFTSDGRLATKVFTGKEFDILSALKQIMVSNPKCRLIAHNGKKFDFPFATRRMIFHRIPVISPLNAYGKKPWEMHGLLDTVDMWASTEFNPYISLDVLCELLGVESPKEGEVTGDMLGDYYWADPEGSIKKIGEYCGRDTVALAKVHKILEDMLVAKLGDQ
jgi:hypothetical protein